MNLRIDPDKVAAKLDAAGVPAGVREEVIQSVLRILQEVMVSRLESELTEQELEELAQYVDTPNSDEALAWVQKRFPNYEQMVDEELTAIIDDAKRFLGNGKAS